MRKLLFLIVAALCLSLSYPSDKSVSAIGVGKSDCVIRSLMPDSIYSLLAHKPMIFYSYGHYGFSWSLIAKIDSGFRAFSGKVSYSGIRQIKEVTEELDSFLLLSKNRGLLLWGLDTISAGMFDKKISRRGSDVIFYPNYTNLSVIDSDGVSRFSSDGTIAFSGPDSIDLNGKLDRLCLMMRWLSAPEIRQYIPASVIF